jgi:hypothetical protein
MLDLFEDGWRLRLALLSRSISATLCAKPRVVSLLNLPPAAVAHVFLGSRSRASQLHFAVVLA